MKVEIEYTIEHGVRVTLKDSKIKELEKLAKENGLKLEDIVMTLVNQRLLNLETSSDEIRILCSKLKDANVFICKE